MLCRALRVLSGNTCCSIRNPRVSRVPRPQLPVVTGDINLALPTRFGASKGREDICSGPLDGWLESLEMMTTLLSTRRVPQSQIGSGRVDAAE
jgi:hypothetical protein